MVYGIFETQYEPHPLSISKFRTWENRTSRPLEVLRSETHETTPRALAPAPAMHDGRRWRTRGAAPRRGPPSAVRAGGATRQAGGRDGAGEKAGHDIND